MFTTGSVPTSVIESDHSIVRILRESGPRQGITRAEAMPIVRQIAAELEAHQAEAQ